MHAAVALRRMLDNSIYVQRMLGGRGLAGLVLMEAFFSGDPWLSTRELAERSTLSDDTIRRRMVDLVNTGRVIVRTENGGKSYAIAADTAHQIMARLAAREPLPVEVPPHPQLTVASCG